MADEPSKTGDQGYDNCPTQEVDQAPYRGILLDELTRILKDHAEWVASDGMAGTRAQLQLADLQGHSLAQANLQGAWLIGANFQKARFHNANLRGAELSTADLRGAYLVETDLQVANLSETSLEGAFLTQANLRGADLSESKLQGAILFEANLQGAKLFRANLEPFHDALTGKVQVTDLTHAKLRDADLSEAQFTNVSGLQSGQLGGANLSNAKIPTHIAEFEGLAHVEEVSKHARNVFLAVIGGCVYSWLTIATTTDVALLTNSGSSPLPIIQTNVPIAGFYWAAPAILLGLYVYLHMYLQRLWAGLASLPAVFEDGRTLEERAYPWLLTSLASAHMPRLANRRPVFSRTQVFLSMISAWVLVPFTIGWFWIRYLPLHDWPGTFLHISLFTISVVFAVIFYWLASKTLKGHDIKVFSWRAFWQNRTSNITLVVAFALAFFFASVSDGAINGFPKRDYLTNHIHSGMLYRSETFHRRFIPRVFEFFRFRTYLDIRGADVSSKPSNWTGLGKSPEDLTKSDHKQIRVAQLAGRDLRFVVADGAFFVGANLQSANFQGAHLDNVNFQNSNLARANLSGAVMFGSIFFDAILVRADLTHTGLNEVDFRQTAFFGTNLAGASLGFSKTVTQGHIDSACFDPPIPPTVPVHIALPNPLPKCGFRIKY